jgi:nucleoside-diphosphate-sugar epimerase
MRILVIGGTGFSGPHVARRLMDMGHQIALFHRGHTQAELPDDLQHILGDRKHLGDYADKLRRFAPQTVLDMIPIAEHDARSVMAMFRGIAQRVVALSSQDVYRAYGKLIRIESGPPESVPLAEDSRLRTKLYPYRSQAAPDHWAYHYEKILAERVFTGDPELPGTILRLPMVYGPRDKQHRLFQYLKRMDDNRVAILLEEGLARWRWTRGYVEDVSRAIVLAVTDQRAKGRIYNVGEREALSEAEWVKAIGKAAGWQGQIVTVLKHRLPEHLALDYNTDQDLVVDTTRIRQELGYQEQMPRHEALQRTVEWERAHPPEQVDAKVFDYRAEDAFLAEMGR